MAKPDSLWLIESVIVIVLRLMGPFSFLSELFLPESIATRPLQGLRNPGGHLFGP